MKYYERWIGDYIKDTAHLSLLEHGVYSRLMDVYYTRESGIPADEVARLIGARSRDERDALAAVLKEFFALTEAGVHENERCKREIGIYLEKQAKAKRSANARWHPENPTVVPPTDAGKTDMQTPSEWDKTAHAKGDAQAMRTHSDGNALQSSVLSPQSSIPKTKVKKTEREVLPGPENPGAAGAARLSLSIFLDPETARKAGVQDVPREEQIFRDHWAAIEGEKAIKTDLGWAAAWRNWCRRYDRTKLPGAGGVGQGSVTTPGPVGPDPELLKARQHAQTAKRGIPEAYKADVARILGKKK